VLRQRLAWLLLLASCKAAGPAAGDAPHAGPSPSPPHPTAAPSTAPDVQSVLQAVLDAPKLQQYFHPTAEGRVPVVLTGAGLSPDLRLAKFGQPVRVLDRPATGDKSAPVVEVMRLDIEGGRATVELRYEVEGLRVRAELTRGSVG
jgi:hypothetical protein